MTCCAEASIRYVVTSLQGSDAAHLYETVYCARAGRESYQAAQDAIVVRSHQLPIAARRPDATHPAHRCLLAAARPARRDPDMGSAAAQRICYDPFALRKIAGRVIETANRIRIALASCCPHPETFSLIAHKLQPSGP
jgi:hypothetical protein